MGRKHSGLTNPEKYGLTYNQVVELIESGRWKAFYENWKEKEDRKKARGGARPWEGKRNRSIKKPKDVKAPEETFKCTNCNKVHLLTTKHFLIGEHIYICLKCAELITQLHK
jgi:hypothetical protein